MQRLELRVHNCRLKQRGMQRAVDVVEQIADEGIEMCQRRAYGRTKNPASVPRRLSGAGGRGGLTGY